jgi:hypothetical protein
LDPPRAPALVADVPTGRHPNGSGGWPRKTGQHVCFTRAMEIPIYLFALRDQKRPRALLVLIAFGPSAITHPIVWFVIPNMVHRYVRMAVVAELFAVFVEGCYFQAVGVRRAPNAYGVTPTATLGDDSFALLPNAKRTSSGSFTVDRMGQRVSPAGVFAPTFVAGSSPGGLGVPALATRGTGLVVAWVEYPANSEVRNRASDDSGQLRMVRLDP